MNCIITGGTRGIGRYFTCGLLALGHRVIAITRTNKSADEFRTDIINGTTECDVYVCDVTDYRSVNHTINKILEDNGRIDALINNAGISGPTAEIAESDPFEWAECIVVNIIGTYNCARAILPHFLHNHSGRIVNLASSHCVKKLPKVSCYSSSKIAVTRFTELLDLEYSERGIYSFAMHPGTIETDMTRNISKQMKDGEALVPILKKKIKCNEMDPPFDAMHLVSDLVTGRHDRLSGRYLQAKYDIDQIERNIDGIKKYKLLEITIKTVVEQL